MKIKLFVTVICLLTLVAEANEIDEELASNSADTTYYSPNHEELHNAKQVFKWLFQGNAVPHWHTFGMEVNQTRYGVMISEHDEEKRGQGLFMLRQTNDAKPWLIQAPHADTDLYTGKIASRLYIDGNFRAGQWNTVPRHIKIKGEISKADQAHLAQSYWQEFTRIFAEQHPEGLILQLHGFSQKNRKTEAGVSSDMILSSGTKYPPKWLRQTAVCLKTSLNAVVRVYPYEVKELGGTTNAQGQLLRSMGHSGFLHLEMSKTMRSRLLHQSKLRQKLLGCLSERGE